MHILLIPSGWAAQPPTHLQEEWLLLGTEGTGLAGKEGRARETDLAWIFVLFWCKLLGASGPLSTTMVHPDLTQPV